MKACSTSGAMNSVSTSLHSSWFICAIWNSYSKSDTARSPRMMKRAPVRRANSTSKPEKDTHSTRGSPENTARTSSSRSSTGKSRRLAWVDDSATPTTSRSQKRKVRRATSS